MNLEIGKMSKERRVPLICPVIWNYFFFCCPGMQLGPRSGVLPLVKIKESWEFCLQIFLRSFRSLLWVQSCFKSLY